ncbi:MAG TPA: aminoacyl-tRNA hydrolase [Deltaproteobacteria bacterium]|nr:aminoacyl-tRNA hydrolase [Deltaproteobacteria bacterium]HCP44496.1 aminoacyl-tRNA hydrolase [Deltaproteobacteria bacterium]
MYLVVGLGNPGARYERTRHNVGFDVVRSLAERHGVQLTQKRFRAVLGTGNISGESSLLALPQTWMNLSGDSVGPMAGFYKVPRDSVLVVHDDLDLPFGTVKVKGGGGHGGHNGLRDLVQKLGGSDFVRVRVGIGRPQGPMDTKSWVLSRWSQAEDGLLSAIMDRAQEAIEAVLRDGVKSAMNGCNGLVPIGSKDDPGNAATGGDALEKEND